MAEIRVPLPESYKKNVNDGVIPNVLLGLFSVTSVEYIELFLVPASAPRLV